MACHEFISFIKFFINFLKYIGYNEDENIFIEY